VRMLGVDCMPMRDQIVAAYRDKAKRAHPGTGGSHEAMTGLCGPVMRRSRPSRVTPDNAPVSWGASWLLGLIGTLVIFIGITISIGGDLSSGLHHRGA
jgi:hypothetical protein